MQKLRRRLAGPLLITGVLIALSAGGLALGVFGGFQRATTDRLFPAATADARIAVVGIDGRSISDLGERWPWPRELQAKLIRAIAAERPRLIVYDVVVGAPSAGDDQLSAALHEAGNVVLAAAADVSATSHGRFFEARTIAGPTTSVASAAVGIGLTNITADPGDGVVRSLPLVIESPSGNLLPSIALEAAVRTTGQPDTPTIRPDGVQVGSVLMPTESRASLTINFAEPLDVGAPAAPYSSAADVLRGSLPGRRLAGKVVLVGVVDPTLGDVHLTPVNKSGGMPGVFVLANGVNTILTRAYVHRSSRLETIASIAMLAFAVALLTRLLPVWLSPAPLIAAGAGYLVFAFLRFDAGYVMDLVYPELSVAGAFVGGLGARAYGELATAWKVPPHTFPGRACAVSRAARASISWAARLVKVSRSTRSGGVPDSMSRATRHARVHVLPVPAPATTSNGPSPWVTASRWAVFSCASHHPGSPTSPPPRDAPFAHEVEQMFEV